ncbi:MAG TPA: hypothetical protein VMG09_12400 [Bacteroidota bacterium]|nr:hypothetical protein [Bacteroidota bacterium]
MKQLLAILAMLLCLVLVATPMFAQSNAYNKGDKVVSAGIGFGGLGGLYGSTSMPTISLGFDYGLDVPKISVGGIVGYASSTDDFGFGYSWKYTYIVIGARGAYHFLEDNKNIDAYAGILLGYNVVSASWNGSQAQPYYSSASASYMLFGAFVGGRYYFSPKFGVFAELGYGAGILTAGISYKL